jgi:uncharacterized repeat protein (TIGR01451 family)
MGERGWIAPGAGAAVRVAATGVMVGFATVFMALSPSQPAGAATAPVVSCSSDENIFNTGYDAATRGVLANAPQDANWEVAGPFDTPSGTTPPTAVSPPPASATFKAANVGNLIPSAWAASPYGNAQWISQQTLASPKQPDVDGDWYYQYQFDLDPSVNPSTFSLDVDFLADNDVAEVYVNGVAQSSQTTGLPQAPSTSDPYHFKGFVSTSAATTTLDHNWQTGTNTIVVQIKSGYPYEGFDAQMRPSTICPEGLSVTKTAAPDPYLPGHKLTYTVIVANAGPDEASDVAVSDPLPAALSGGGFTWTCVASAGSTCAASGTGAITDKVTVAAGGTLTYTVTGTVPASASGTLTNTVTLTPTSGTVDTGCTPSCSATNTDPLQVASLTVAKSSSPASYSAAGNIVTYDFLVTNTGNVTLDSVTVNDTETAPAVQANLSAIHCPSSSLAPQASETCTATYTVAAADVTKGSISDSATAAGTPPVGSPVVSLPSTLTVRAVAPAATASSHSTTPATAALGKPTTARPGSLAFTGLGSTLDRVAVLGAALMMGGGLLLAGRFGRRRLVPATPPRHARRRTR